MKVGELFIGLKIQGAPDAQKQLKQTRDGMSSLKDMALETKAAILAAVVALEKLMRAPVETGASLYEAAKYTGESVENLQKIQSALKSVDPSEVMGMYNTLFLNFAKFTSSVGPIMGSGGLAAFLVPKPEDFKNTTALLDYIIRAFNVPAMSPERAAVIAEQMGFSPKMLVAFREQALKTRSVLDFGARGMMSGGMAKQMYGMQGQFNQIAEQTKKAFGTIVAAIGPNMLETASKAVDAFSKLVAVLTELGTAINYLGSLKGAMDNIASGLTGVAKSAESAIGGLTGKLSPVDAIKGMAKQYMNAYKLSPQFIIWDAQIRAGKAIMDAMPKKTQTEEEKILEKSIRGPHSSTLNQTINIDGATESAESISDAIKRSTKDAFYQITAQTQIA